MSTPTPIVNLKQLVDDRVTGNVAVQDTLDAKQAVLDSVATATAIADGIAVSGATERDKIEAFKAVKITELNNYSAAEQLEIANKANLKVTEYDANAADRLTEYNDNASNAVSTYNTNDSTKLAEYNANHIDRLNDINYAYANRIVDMIKTRNFMGIMDEYVAQTKTNMIPFLSTADSNYIYYGNGVLLTEGIDYTVYDTKTIELVLKTSPYDTIVQVNTRVLKEMLTAEGALFDTDIGVANGVASLNNIGQVPSIQLPSYVDDVLEFATYAALPATGELGKIYLVVADETSNGDTSSYRWTGTIYAMVSNTLTTVDIKNMYESNANTNAYTDAEKVLLDVHTSSTGAHGVTEVLGATEIQTITNKELDSSTNWIGADNVHYTVKATEIISAGSVVMGVGYNSVVGAFEVAKWTAASGNPALGITTKDIPNGSFGLIVQTGHIKGIDTSLLTVNTTCYPADGGGLTEIRPTVGPYQEVAFVLRSHTSQGALTVDFSSPIMNLVSTDIPVTPNGNLSSTDVQSALQELQASVDTINSTIEW